MSEKHSSPELTKELPKAYDPSVIEERWADYWVRERLFDVPTPQSTQDDSRKFTMDDRLAIAVKEAFIRLYEQGLIYRGAYIVNWDPSIQTAVSDLEVEHEERLGKLYHIRYPLADGPLPDGTGHITVATTRPETMLGDTAVAVNPTDARYTALTGKKVRAPMTGVNAGPGRAAPTLAHHSTTP